MKLGLTGKTRHRAQKRFLREPLLVLQVQTVIEEYTPPDYFGKVPVWRDAKTHDLEMLQELNNV